MIREKTVTQNTTYYTLALVFQKILAFVFFTFLARGLGAEDLGKYVFAFSFTTIFSVFVDVGLSSVLTRETARDHSKTEKILNDVLGLKLILAVLVYILIFFLVNILHYPELTRQLVYITAFIMLADNFSTTFWGVLRGRQNLKYESLGIFLFQLIILVLGFTFLYLGFSVKIIASATLFASLFFVFFSFLQVKKRLDIQIRPSFDKKLTIKLLQISIPFALTGIFARLNTQIDTVLLSKMGCLSQSICDQNVGVYSIASKIVLAIHFIPLAFTAALFPAMSRFFAEDKTRLASIFEKSIRYLLIISTPIAFGIFTLAPAFVPAIFGLEYTGSVLPLRILAISIIFLFVTFPIGSLLNASSRQLRNSVHIGLAVLVNLILNIILIPRMTFTGAAISSFASTLVILLLGVVAINQSLVYNKKGLLLVFFRSLLAGLLMWYLLSLLLFKVHFVLLIALGALIYFATLFLLGELRKKDLSFLLKFLKK